MSITPGAADQSGVGTDTSDLADENANRLPDEAVDETVNLTIIWFLGLTLLGIVGTLIGLSVSKTTFPEGLTTLASLIAGGLLGIVNPTRSIKQRSTSGNSRRTGLRSKAKTTGN
jgi:hypothetical protein